MAPRLFQLFGVAVPSYFVLLLVSFAIAIVVARRWAKGAGYNPAIMTDLGLLLLVVGVLGARLAHILFDGHVLDYINLCVDPAAVHWRVEASQCERMGGSWNAAGGYCSPVEADCFRGLKFWTGGLTLYGGLLVAVPFAWWFLRREGVAMRRAADGVALTLLVAVAIGRLGCFLGGCCFGTPARGWYAVSFPSGSPASVAQWRSGLLASPWLPSQHVHATQLYEAAFCLLLAGALWAFARRARYLGQLSLGALAGYAVLRGIVEWFRADERGAFAGLSTSQWIGIGAVLFAAYLHHQWSEKSA